MIENLIERFFEAASMQRWNDHIRPVELTELDKQAHKMVIAYVIAKIEEDRKGEGHINWLNLIESFIFEFLYRLVLTDIKPPVFHRMMAEKRQELNNHVLNKLEKDLNNLEDDGFKQKFKNYFSKNCDTMNRNKQICIFKSSSISLHFIVVSSLSGRRRLLARGHQTHLFVSFAFVSASGSFPSPIAPTLQFETKEIQFELSVPNKNKV